MSLKESLIKIQSELKAPKGQVNNYGGYKYRSCEDILEAVKPLLKAENCIMTLSDAIEYIGARYYVKATASIIQGDEKITNVAFAREEDTKKGMDGAQITGTASSYARKYALNGLFLIDDTKDVDTEKTEEKATETATKPKKEEGRGVTQMQINILKQLAEEKGKALDLDALKKYTAKQASDLIQKLRGEKNE